ncbi:MAG TPA: DUF6036 family nucleotidyltransferase [Thermoanaerobaculia bacterium]
MKDLFERLRTALDAAEVPYMVVGSFASSVHGLPRATRDVDIVIAPTREQLLRLIGQLPDTSYYADREQALDALKYRSQFNIVDFVSGWKVDFIIPRLTEFTESQFDRRRVIEISGVPVYVASPEDVVIAKLAWSKEGGSGRQLEDVASIITAQADHLDRRYIERWVRELKLDPEWRSALALCG